MTSLTLNYPVFEGNQVLTADQLNKLFNYLDQQNRLTRTHLLGIGIVCGLELDNPDENVISISRGCGVTSQGYLIHIEACTLTHYKSYSLPEKMHDPFSDNEEPASLYIPFYKDLNAEPPIPYDLWELLSEDDFAPEDVPEQGIEPLSIPVDFLQDKAVLLFMECPLVDLKNCLNNDCDDKGLETQGTVRKLLIGIDDLIEIIQAAENLDDINSEADLREQLRGELALPDLFIRRFNVPASGFQTFQDISQAYCEIIEPAIPDIGAAIAQLYGVYASTFASNPNSLATPLTQLEAHFQNLQNTNPLGIQYYYDFLCDLIQAYHELKDKACDLLVECCPSGERFPKHLMLGKALTINDEQPSTFRHDFYHAAIHNYDKDRLAEVRMLFQRLVQMLDCFVIPEITDNDSAVTQIKITPSRYGHYDLSEKAIPYYFQLNETHQLQNNWNYPKQKKGKSDQNLSYHADQYSSIDAITSPLHYDMEAYNFLRIEGHIGFHKDDVLSTLNTLKNNHRLPFDVVSLEISTEAHARFIHYLQKHPGINHRAGVPQGGTFVIVSSGNGFTPQAPEADFQLANVARFNTTIAITPNPTALDVSALQFRTATSFIGVSEEENTEFILQSAPATAGLIANTINFNANSFQSPPLLGLIDYIQISNPAAVIYEPQVFIYPGAVKSSDLPGEVLLTFIHFNALVNSSITVTSDDWNVPEMELSTYGGFGQNNNQDALTYFPVKPDLYRITIQTNSGDLSPRIFTVDLRSEAGQIFAMVVSGQSRGLELLGVKPDGQVISFPSNSFIRNVLVGNSHELPIEAITSESEPTLSVLSSTEAFSTFLSSQGISASEALNLSSSFFSLLQSQATLSTRSIGSIEGSTLQIAPGTVVADFFLPYHCCPEEPCTLPCNGDVEASLYRFPTNNAEILYWMNRGDANFQNTLRIYINALTIGDRELIGPNSPQMIDIPRSLFQRGQSTPESYLHNFQVISTYLNLYTEGYLVFGVSQENIGDNLDQIIFTRFACESLFIDINVTIGWVGGDGAPYDIPLGNAQYTEQGILGRSGTISIPKEVLAQTNQCDCNLPSFGKIEIARYRWIDSFAFLAAYINPSNGFPENLGQDYAFTILEYVVGDQILVSPSQGAKEIIIPNADLTNGLGTIMQRLNEEFPTGVVFSYEPRFETDSFFTIRRYVSDRFRLRVAVGRLDEINPLEVYIFTDTDRKYFQLQGNQIQEFDYTPGKSFVGIEDLC